MVLDRKGHDAIVSTSVLEAAGITATTADPAGGRIERDASGAPTGLLIEHPAVDLARSVQPEPDLATRIRWIELGQAELLGLGITTAMDPAVTLAEIPAWVEAARTGRLRHRAVLMPRGEDSVARPKSPLSWPVAASTSWPPAG